MNKIIVTQEQLDNILLWRDKNKDLVRSFKPYLNDGEISIINSDIVIKFNVKYDRTTDAIIDIEVSYHTDKWIKCYSSTAKIVSGGYSISEEKFYELKKFFNDTEKYEYRLDVFGCFFAINAYFFHYRADISQLETKRVERHSKIIKGMYKYENVKVLERKYTIEGKIRHNKIPLHRAWHIDCWNVTGHIRHLKSGKEVYIKPYKKGKNRNSETNNIYKIER